VIKEVMIVIKDYLVGVFDMGGSIFVSKKKLDKYYPRIRFKHENRWLVEQFREVFGVGYVKAYKTVYTWEVAKRKEVLELAKKFQTLLVLKAEHARLARELAGYAVPEYDLKVLELKRLNGKEAQL
jgi:hypothetical protein